MEVFSTALVAIFGILLFIFFRKWTKFSGYLQSLGIPLDTEVPWLKQNFMYLNHDVKCLNKFGHVWGRYDGVTPVLMVAEPELIKEIMVKKFDKFPNHAEFGVEEQVGFVTVFFSDTCYLHVLRILTSLN